jgi:hypothetical protein
VPRHAGAVAEQVADRHLAVGGGVAQLEEVHVPADRVVPFQLALGDEQGDRCGGERLGAGGNGEDGVRRDRLAAALMPHAEALQVNDLVVLDHGHGGARYLERFHRLGRQPVQGRRVHVGGAAARWYREDQQGGEENG